MSVTENNESGGKHGGKGTRIKSWFWRFLGVVILLFIVYQSGRSSGIRSVTERSQDIRSVVESSLAPVSVPMPSSGALSLSSVAKAPPQRVQPRRVQSS